MADPLSKKPKSGKAGANPKAGQKGGNPFTRKIGPLPGWAWCAIGVSGIVLYLHFKGSSSSSGTSSTTATPDTSTDSDAADYQGLLDALASGEYAASSPGATSTTTSSGTTSTSPGGKTGTKSKSPLTNYSLESKVGSGYNADNQGAFIGKKSGDTYQYAGAAGHGTIAQLLKSGVALFYQSSEGVTTRITNANQVKAGTPVYTISKYNPKPAPSPPAKKK
jgi:hypothetical protein